MSWTWDPDKNRINQRVHGLSFETALKVFDDPLALSKMDLFKGEERWHTVGRIENVTILVVHTWSEAQANSQDFEGRIISARKATAHERRIYEEGDF